MFAILTTAKTIIAIKIPPPSIFIALSYISNLSSWNRTLNEKNRPTKKPNFAY